MLQCLRHPRVNFEMVHSRGDLHSHEIRSRCKIDLPHVRLVKTDKSRMIMASKLFNKLRLEIKLLSDSE